MKAQITDGFDLVLTWGDDCHCEIIWSACSECEFEVRAKLMFQAGLNYQGSTQLNFSTTCYAYALRFFADELDQLVSGSRTSADYTGSCDMSIRIRDHRGQGDFIDRTIRVCELSFEMIRSIDMVACDSTFVVTLGRPEDPTGVAKAIRQVISSLGLDDTLEGQFKQYPTN